MVNGTPFQCNDSALSFLAITRKVVVRGDEGRPAVQSTL
jgi:hypothetical protein